MPSYSEPRPLEFSQRLKECSKKQSLVRSVLLLCHAEPFGKAQGKLREASALRIRLGKESHKQILRRYTPQNDTRSKGGR